MDVEVRDLLMAVDADVGEQAVAGRDEPLIARDRADLETASFAAGRADLVEVIAAKSALALLELEILEREQMAVEAAATLRLTYGEDRP